MPAESFVSIHDPLARLPPLPTPEYETQYVERARGITLVLSLITVFVVSTTVILQQAALEPELTWSCSVLIWAEALLALICLAGIQFGDPGTVKRSESTCLPIPDEVDQVISGGAPRLLGNLDGVDGRVYCVRCHLWRPNHIKTTAVHHCRVCQRCVVHFDHHCGVLGRCIAGKGLAGNMKYFIGLICLGHVGFLTFAVSCGIAVLRRWGLEAFGIAIGAAFVALGCGLGLCNYCTVEVVFKRYLLPPLLCKLAKREERRSLPTTNTEDPA